MIIEGRFLKDGRIEEGYIFIDKGFIVDIRKTIEHNDKVDYRFMRDGVVIFPGFIDIHVHMRDFSQGYKEDFLSGSSAAAAGGITFFIDMPNTEPRNNRLSILEYRDEVASKKSVVDYALNYGVPPSLDDLFGYEEIAIGMKFYPTDFHEYKIDHLSDILIYNYAKGLVTVFHAEDPEGYMRGEEGIHLEIDASKYIAEYTKTIGVKTHFTHITCCDVVETVKNINSRVTVDTTPHHIMLTNEDVKHPYRRVRPPLRDGRCRDCLLKYLVDGKVDIYATDHAPHTLEEKSGGANGFPGLETSVAILTTLHNKGLISLRDIANLYSKNPAVLYGIDHLYGDIDVGRLASITVVDLKEEWIVDPSTFYTKAKHSPFEGMRLIGRVKSTFVRGMLVYDGENIVAKPGGGVNIVKRFRRR